MSARFILKRSLQRRYISLGMISRGEVGLIVAGVAISVGAITQSTYAAILGMIMITTVPAPILLIKVFDNEPPEEQPRKQKMKTQAYQTTCQRIDFKLCTPLAVATFYLTARASSCPINLKK